MSKGYVYVLENASMPGLLKIGKTTRSVEQRCHELFVTGVPAPFTVWAEVYSPDCHNLERRMHEEFANDRVSASREFFASDKLAVEQAIYAHLRGQVEELIDEFLPDHVITASDLSVPEGTILALAEDLGTHPFHIASSIDHLTAEEIKPAHDRLMAIIDRRKAAMDNETPMPSISRLDVVTIQ